jgi:integrase
MRFLMHHSNTDVINAFMDPTSPTMADVIAVVVGDTTIPITRRRNLASSIRRFCKALGSEPSKVPANYAYIRNRLKRFHPLEAGIKKKRWQTIISDVNAALAIAGITKGQTRGLAPISSAWAQFMSQIDGRQNWGFSRLARYCSNRNLPPVKVNDAVIAGFAAAMKAETFKTNIDRLMRELCCKWNALTEALPEAGLAKVTLPSKVKVVSVPWEQLAVSFKADLEKFLAEMSTDVHPISRTGPVKPLKPASVDSYRRSIRYAHAALVRSGFPSEEITSLAVLVQLDNAEALLRNLYDRNGEKKSSTIHGIAHVLFLIAGPGGRAPEGVADILKTFRKRSKVPYNGLRERPREALRQFAATENIEAILALPVRIYDRLRPKTKFSIGDARKMQVAVALELLLMRPIRRKNLTELRFGDTIIRRGKNVFVRLSSGTVKNTIDIDHQLPPESAELLEFYVQKLSPLFGPNSNEWLFPGEIAGAHKSYAQVGRQITKTIRDETGLYFYPHLARHFAAKLYLDEHPGAFEVVRRVLAHKSLTTTTRCYVGFADDAAVRMYDELILRIRQSIEQGIKDAKK